MVDPGTPCNVVASHSGQIWSFRSTAASLSCKREAVLEGHRFIVSGITQDKGGKTPSAMPGQMFWPR